MRNVLPPRWTKKNFEEQRDEIVNELKSLDHKQCFALAIGQVGNLANDFSGFAQLRRYIYLMIALVQHQRYGSLKADQAQNLLNIGHAILQIHKINPEKSNLSFLYADLHTIASQIHRLEGNIWQSAWESHLAARYSAHSETECAGFHDLTFAYRAERLGQMQLAYESFRSAEAKGLDPANWRACRLGLIRSLRLSGNLSRAQQIADDTQNHPYGDEAFARELNWEAACRQASRDGAIDPLTKLTKRGKSHYLGSYVVEGFLWAKTGPLQKSFEQLSIRTIRRKCPFNKRTLGSVMKAALTIESSYDVEIPYGLRIKNLNKVLGNRQELLTIDKEMLLLASAARWLARNFATNLAALVLGEYEGLCLKASRGKDRDILGFSGDLLEKGWYKSA
jgi:hypothetical protein